MCAFDSRCPTRQAASVTTVSPTLQLCKIGTKSVMCRATWIKCTCTVYEWVLLHRAFKETLLYVWGMSAMENTLEGQWIYFLALSKDKYFPHYKVWNWSIFRSFIISYRGSVPPSSNVYACLCDAQYNGVRLSQSVRCGATVLLVDYYRLFSSCLSSHCSLKRFAVPHSSFITASFCVTDTSMASVSFKQFSLLLCPL